MGLLLGQSPFAARFVRLSCTQFPQSDRLRVTRDKILYGIIGLLAGFIIGFAFSNTANRNELDTLRAELARARAGGQPAESAGATASPSPAGNGIPQLSEEDLRRAIARGDASPNDINMQRNLGRGLYLYAVQTGNNALLTDAVRFLKRAHEAEPTDYITLVLVANALLDVGQAGNPASFAEARTYYEKALQMRPNDVDVRTDLGLTYFLNRPSDPRGAIREYRRALALDPRNEKTLQHLTAALIAARELAEAEQRLGELERLNPSNAALPDLRAQLAQQRNAANTAAREGN